MFARALCSALLLIGLTASAHASDPWKVTAVGGVARMFSEGDWSELKVGDLASDSALLRAAPEGALVLTRGAEKISLAANSEIQIQDRSEPRFTLVRLHSGTVAVAAEPENTVHFAVQTPHVVATADDAIFGVETDGGKSFVSNRRGMVEITDLTRNTRSEVHEGQTARIVPSSGVKLGPAVESEPATLAAMRLADGSGPAHSASAALLRDAQTIDQAGPAARPAPSVMLADDPYVENAHFSWVEGREGRPVMTPLFKILLRLQGFEAAIVWPSILFGFLFLGFFLHLTLQDVAFGGFPNAAIALIAACAGILMRDYALVDATYIRFEPILSAGLMVGSLLFLLLAIRLAANRLA